MTPEGRAYSRSLVVKDMEAAVKDLQNYASECQADWDRGEFTQDVLVREDNLHCELMAIVQNLVKECMDLSDSEGMEELYSLGNLIRKESSAFTTLIQELTMDQLDTQSQASRDLMEVFRVVPQDREGPS
jgi:hypothetical protein